MVISFAPTELLAQTKPGACLSASEAAEAFDRCPTKVRGTNVRSGVVLSVALVPFDCPAMTCSHDLAAVSVS